VGGLFSLFRPTVTPEPFSEITQGRLGCRSGLPALPSGGCLGDMAGDSSPLPSSNILQHMLHLPHQPSAATSDATHVQPGCSVPGHRGKPRVRGARFLNDEQGGEGMMGEGIKSSLNTLKCIPWEPKLNGDRLFSVLVTETRAGLWLPALAKVHAESESVPAENLPGLVKRRKLLWASTTQSKSLLQTCQLLSKQGAKRLLYF